jgi:hypothetical protein
LLALHFVQPELFNSEVVPGGRHVVVGNSAAAAAGGNGHGVRDGDQCRAELCKLVNRAADKTPVCI